MLFTEKEFATFRNFQNRLAKEFGETAYVGADNAGLGMSPFTENSALFAGISPVMKR